jgi:dsDNA-specific endonuclease/ATPase MutS2|tara:strand:- start:238 stop:507 length:270 start_codon:yes stop_codon:yes gene_type:complete
MDELIKQIKNIDNPKDLQKINSVLSSQWTTISNNKKKEFNVGDTVRLIDRGIDGIITKINPKTIDIKTESIWGEQGYRCSPSLLQKVDE